MTALPTAFSPLSTSTSSRSDVGAAVRDVDVRLWALVVLAGKQCPASTRDKLIEAAQRISSEVRDAVAAAFGADAVATPDNRKRTGSNARARKAGQ